MIKFSTGSFAIDHTMQIWQADESFYSYISYDSSYSLLKCVHPQDLPRIRSAVEELSSQDTNMVAFRLKNRDGEYHWILAEMENEAAGDSSLGPYIRVNIQDIQTLKEEIAEIKDEGRKSDLYLELSNEVFFQYCQDADQFMIFRNDEQTVYLYRGTLDEWKQEAVSLSEADCEGIDQFCNMLKGNWQSFELEIALPEKDHGQIRKARYAAKVRRYANFFDKVWMLGCLLPIGDAKNRDSVSLVNVDRDSTTGLLSKKTIIDYCKSLIDRKQKSDFYLCVVDLDDFKNVNDTFGHLFGDEVLATTADIIKNAVGSYGVAGRIGGDEMVFIVENVEENAQLRGILRSIRSGIEWSYKDKLKGMSLTCSIGAAHYPDNADNYDDLFQLADKMLYHAKQKGKNRYVIYTPEIHGNTASESALKEEKHPVGLKQDKDSLVLGLIDLLLKKQAMPYATVLEQVGGAFDLSEIGVFYGNEDGMAMVCSWCRGVPEKQKIEYCKEEAFQNLFNHNGIAVINDMKMLEGVCNDTYNYLNGRGVTAAVIYRMQTGSHSGYVTFFKDIALARKWTSSDSAYLNFIGKIMLLKFIPKST